MSGPERAQHEREKLSALLRDLRVRSGLSGASAAASAGFSQSKLSKIENGLLLPSAADAAALCDAYRTSQRRRKEILGLLAHLRDEVESTRVILQRGAYRKQQEIGRIEAETTLVRGFQPAYVIGLLQIPAYARRIFEHDLDPAEADRAVAARVDRQRVLGEPGRQFRFVMTEGALRWRVGPPRLMAEQMDHLIDVSRLPGVRLGVIPWTTEVALFPTHAFHVYDERAVIVGTLTATATIRDRRDVAAYVRFFSALENTAVFDSAARTELSRIRDALSG